MAKPRYWQAVEPREIAARLLDECKEFRGMQMWRIDFVFRSTDSSGDGCKMLASVRRLSGIVAAEILGVAENEEDFNALPPPIFVVEISANIWEVLEPEGREALIHHELSHIDPLDGVIVGHSIEDFASTVRRYGAWSGNWKSMLAQLTLFDETLDADQPVED